MRVCRDVYVGVEVGQNVDKTALCVLRDRCSVSVFTMSSHLVLGPGSQQCPNDNYRPDSFGP